MKRYFLLAVLSVGAILPAIASPAQAASCSQGDLTSGGYTHTNAGVGFGDVGVAATIIERDANPFCTPNTGSSNARYQRIILSGQSNSGTHPFQYLEIGIGKYAGAQLCVYYAESLDLAINPIVDHPHCEITLDPNDSSGYNYALSRSAGALTAIVGLFPMHTYGIDPQTDWITNTRATGWSVAAGYLQTKWPGTSALPTAEALLKVQPNNSTTFVAPTIFTKNVYRASGTVSGMAFGGFVVYE